jgi:hypothetical protein
MRNQQFQINVSLWSKYAFLLCKEHYTTIILLLAEVWHTVPFSTGSQWKRTNILISPCLFVHMSHCWWGELLTNISDKPIIPIFRLDVGGSLSPKWISTSKLCNIFILSTMSIDLIKYVVFKALKILPFTNQKAWIFSSTDVSSPNLTTSPV